MTDPRDPAERLAALEADNARLRRLLDEGGMPDSLRHGMRNTMAMMRTVLHRSAESSADVETYVAHLDGRFGAIARVQAATDTFGDADLHTLISDELMFHLVREGEQATLTGPRVRLRPRAALVLGLALHELTSNAVEHGSLALSQGRIAVAWQIAEAEAATPVLTLDWIETGGCGVRPPARRGFGTDVIEDMLAYDLGAQASLTYAPDGLRCTVRLPLTARIGRRVPEEAELP
ncbi:Two-component sensor histidine kinase, contains HisKA and HATPase domains [Methylobacterium phyllostachyos]|uniref:histidine kinase n=1 Tax=Methylobacterium phyllostachyos TaxID=582672 RepID=A0A1H0DER1_9HYPH|nr:HWE histidine kinase domain-containing protein [Methylobacterium phyllostachyos]SDN68588.1 Two-component sensor histidine kinase, contains HisKA and HATPase domains [Methylobacterium phyllostachyos]